VEYSDYFQPRSQLRTKALTREENTKFELGQAYLLTRTPFFANLLLQEMRIAMTEDVPVAATDEFTIFLNPQTFYTKYDIPEQAFILCHEVLHTIFRHCVMLQHWVNSGAVQVSQTEMLPFDMDLMQITLDHIINACLVEAKIGKMPKDAVYDQKISAKGEESCGEVYAKIYKQAQKNGGKGGGSGQQGFDVLLAPGAGTPGKDESSRNPENFKLAVQAAAEAAKAMGDMPANLLRIVEEILEPKVSWQEHIRSTLNRRLGSDGYDWRRADRRLITRPNEPIFFASPSSYASGTIVVGVDTSGSIGERELSVFFGEMAGIIADMNPQQLVVIFCDAEVNRVDYVEDVGDLAELRKKGAPGGGGTSFIPVFDEIRKLDLEPDALVYLTDMYGAFPDKEPEYPVIWAATTDVKGPFGDHVHVEL